jgi:hypothetical protein
MKDTMSHAPAWPILAGIVFPPDRDFVALGALDLVASLMSDDEDEDDDFDEDDDDLDEDAEDEDDDDEDDDDEDEDDDFEEDDDQIA